MKKTPYEVAVEQDHETVAKMIKDYESNGPDALTKYEKKKHRPRRERQGGGVRFCVCLLEFVHLQWFNNYTFRTALYILPSKKL